MEPGMAAIDNGNDLDGRQKETGCWSFHFDLHLEASNDVRSGIGLTM